MQAVGRARRPCRPGRPCPSRGSCSAHPGGVQKLGQRCRPRPPSSVAGVGPGHVGTGPSGSHLRAALSRARVRSSGMQGSGSRAARPTTSAARLRDGPRTGALRGKGGPARRLRRGARPAWVEAAAARRGRDRTAPPRPARELPAGRRAGACRALPSQKSPRQELAGAVAEEKTQRRTCASRPAAQGGAARSRVRSADGDTEAHGVSLLSVSLRLKSSFCHSSLFFLEMEIPLPPLKNSKHTS